MTIPLPIIRSISRYLKNQSWKVIFLTKTTLRTSHNDPFILTSIYGTKSPQKAVDLGFLRWVKHLIYYKYRFNNVCLYKNLEIIKWIHHNAPNFDRLYHIFFMDYAGMKGYLDSVKWFHHYRDQRCTSNAIYWTCASGQLDVIQWLHYNRNEGCTENAMDWSSQLGLINLVKWFHHIGNGNCTDLAMERACTYNHFDVVQWLHYNRTEGGSTTQLCSLNMTRWLYYKNKFTNTNFKTTDRDIVKIAAYGGYLDIIQWVHYNINNALYLYLQTKEYSVPRWLWHIHKKVRFSNIKGMGNVKWFFFKKYYERISLTCKDVLQLVSEGYNPQIYNGDLLKLYCTLSK